MVIEPMIAQDLEKKYFFQEISKELGFTALKTGIATLNRPYDADFLNKNFHLSMLVPREGKEKIYKAFARKMIYNTKADGSLVYRNLGITTISPDPDHTERVKELANAFNVPITIVDGSDPDTAGINPFAIPAPHVCALVINSTLASMYAGKMNPFDAYVGNTAHRAIQNVVVLIHVMYPRLNNGLLPTLEDLSLCLTDFSQIEYYTKELQKDAELAAKYSLLITYMEQHFYSTSETNIMDIKKLIHFALTHLDYILNIAAARQVFCKRTDNLIYREILTNGGVVACCTRYADNGGWFNKTMAQFFLNCVMFGMQDTFSMDTRLPHILYIDGFDQYPTDAVLDFFTMGRKFKLGVVAAAHTLAGIGGVESTFVQQVSANCPTKLSFGECTPEDYDWWEREFMKRREWEVSNNYNSDDEAYGTNLGGVKWTWKDTMAQGKQHVLGHKEVVYKMRDKYGRNKSSFGAVDNVPSKYLAPHRSKTYNFGRYCLARPQREAVEKDPRFDPKQANFDEEKLGDVDPIYMNTTDSNHFFNNDDAVSFNLPRGRK
ncbi:MAG: hypothetical protein FWC79_01455 [Oscillospiraceae bacterium]|nr:hypothetical protein [Oscillospiraceae bacterium]